MFIDYSTIVVLYKSEDGQKSEDELHVDFMLGQPRRRLTYI